MVAITEPARSAPKRRRHLLGVLGIGVLVASAAACNVPRRYDVATVASGLSNPWDASFASDGSLFFTERAGDVNVLRAGQVTTLNRPADVVAQGEGGMMGIAVDPAFDSNRRIYTCYLTAGDVRVVRFTVSGDYTTLGEQTPLVTGIPRTSGRHSGCRTRFGPDGALWVTTGDSAQSGLSQSPVSLGGKVLRINTDGSPAGGNIAETRPEFLPQIYAYGFRNPQGISWRPTDNTPFLIEHGPTCEDEITPLSAGGNGGWDPGPGYDEGVPMTDLAKFPDALRPAWSSGCPTIAPSGGTFVRSQLWGARSGQMAMAVLKGRQLRMINLGDGQSDQGGDVITGQGRLREAVEGPDGLLYLLVDDEEGSILQVTPVL